ncbi:MAG: intracellular sulfur oxidation DsrE/DsrF family protein [Psychromonas sp.]|jgi:intracellular sulfur oxidation DsrE/DsrF family protein|uniref:CapA family protein n=1 Tax=Psychromonas sp. TaxID=1884585 RepID=UPI0039E3C3C4
MDILNRSWTVKLEEYTLEIPRSNMLFLGDIALARGVARTIERYGNDYSFAHIREVFLDKSAIIFNLECCLTDRGQAWEPKPVLMNGKAQYLDIFPQGANYVANVANNHFLDLGVLGAQDTIDAVYKKGMGCFGAIDDNFKNFEHTINLPSSKISLIAYSPAAHPFTDSAEVNVSYKSVNNMIKDVEKLKIAADLLIVSLHQGVEFCRYTDRVSRKRAYALIDAGADCIICHHTHVIQGIEIYKGKAIFYGIGNFLIDIDTKAMPNTKYSLGLEFSTQGEKIKEIKVVPFFINDELQVEYLEGENKNKLRLEINWLSSFFNNSSFSWINYALARYMWLKLHLNSVASMYKRAGLVAVVRYYLSRTIAKTLNR